MKLLLVFKDLSTWQLHVFAISNSTNDILKYEPIIYKLWNVENKISTMQTEKLKL